ncbi:mitochondrial carrier [Atractiella rhizophila]|nr:mitochondrial carrier [Atractiella rhizophila]
MSGKGKKPDSPTASLLAGAFAGVVEGFVTYPAEFVKTQSQFATSQGQKPPSPFRIASETVRTRGFFGLYSGVGALVSGNALKAGVRFFLYDKFKSLLADADGRVSGARSVVAGMGAGMCEAIIAVTPSETIKTKLIDDAKSPNPRLKGLMHGTRTIVAEEGLRGIYRGVGPVMARQAANSAVRFSTYSSLKSMVQGNMRPGQTMPSSVLFGIGVLSGTITVYATMPLDVVKTRMQTLDAKKNYKNSFHCAWRILTEEGVLKFWKGATPRLARVAMSGGIVFMVYDKTVVLLGGRDIGN